MKLKDNQQGFSLIELTFVIIIFSIIAIISTQMLSQGLSASKTGQDVINAAWQGQVALERMSRDIQSIRSQGDISTALGGTLTFTDSTGTSVTYTTSGSTLTRNSQVLADGISGLTFTYYDDTGTSTSTIANIRYVRIKLDITNKLPPELFPTAQQSEPELQ